jgi:hypothetical protein
VTGLAAPAQLVAARQQLKGGAARVPWIVTSTALATLAVGVVLQAAGTRLGTSSLPPFVMGWAPRASAAWVVPALVAVALVAFSAPRLLRPAVSPRAFAVAVPALALALGLAVNAARSGPDGVVAVFDLGPHRSFEAVNEYLPALPALSYGARFFLDRFAELVPALPPNAAAHPPGLLLAVHLLGIGSATAFTALVVGVGALSAPLTYLVARALRRPEPAARTAALLCAACPATVLFGVSSADYVYAAAGALAAWLLLRRPWLGAVALAACSLLSWALLAIGAWAVLVTWRRDGLRRAAAVAALCAAALIALDGTLAAAYGYDAFGTLRATERIYRDSVASTRPYAFWLFGSPSAWWLMLGAPLGWLLARAVARRDQAALALAAVVAVAALSGFTKAETERIWLPFVPLACAAAASAPLRRPALAAAALGGQALLVSLLFATVW